MDTLFAINVKRPLAVCLFAAIATLFALPSCNKHNVPLGGECERGEDCDSSGFSCYRPASGGAGYCSKSCVVAPPAGVVPGGPGCESGGLVCAKAPAADKILGAEFCMKP